MRTGQSHKRSSLCQAIHPPELDWRDGGIPVSRYFDDPYFSLSGGLAEARHVFLTGNGLPSRLRPGFHISELGFGAGLNCLALAQIATVPVIMTSFEAYPMSAEQLQRAHGHFPELTELSAGLRKCWGNPVIHVGQVELRLITGDVQQELPRWQGSADAWFLDGFSPAKNPEMWSFEVLAQVARCTSPGGTFATFTAAGSVRRGLEQAGFIVERRKGFGHKRHMSAGYLPPRQP